MTKSNLDMPVPHGGRKALVRVAGYAAVSALFSKSPDRVERLFYDDKTKPRAGNFCSILAKSRKPYRLVDNDELERVAGTAMHGGIVAVALAQSLLPFDGSEAEGWARQGQPLLILDGISNPQNMGAIVRTIAFMGLPRLVLTDHPSQAGLSDASYRIAEGGFEYLELYRLSSLLTVLPLLRPFYRVVATAPGKHPELSSLTPDPRPIALILGNEEAGLSAETLAGCEAVVSIHGAGAIQSLNVSASAAIFLHELIKSSKP